MDIGGGIYPPHATYFGCSIGLPQGHVGVLHGAFCSSNFKVKGNLGRGGHKHEPYIVIRTVLPTTAFVQIRSGINGGIGAICRTICAAVRDGLRTAKIIVGRLGDRIYYAHSEGYRKQKILHEDGLRLKPRRKLPQKATNNKEKVHRLVFLRIHQQNHLNTAKTRVLGVFLIEGLAITVKNLHLELKNVLFNTKSTSVGFLLSHPFRDLNAPGQPMVTPPNSCAFFNELPMPFHGYGRIQ